MNRRELSRRRDRDHAEARAKFAHDVRYHRMRVLNDTGVHRHLKFRSPRSGVHWFELITWPGSLTVGGDMGSYTFSRLTDMFEFFRRSDGGINPQYWAEKLDAVDKNGKVHDFDRSHARALLADMVEDWSPAAKAEVFSDVGRELDDCGMDTSRFLQACERFEFTDYEEYPPKKYKFHDVWEWCEGSEIYTYRFLWCLRAIVWGIAQYDKAKAATATVAP